MSRREHYNLNTRYFGMPTPPPKTTTMTMPGSVDNFPHFADGDVLIVITAARTYKLHSAILRRSSPILAALLDESPAVELSRKAKNKGVTTRYRLHLDLDENEDDAVRTAGVTSPPVLLRRILLDDSGNPIDHYPALLGDANENGRIVPQFVPAWEQVLGAFYNRNIDIGDKDNDGIDYILATAGTVLKVAEYLGNTIIVTRPIEATLLSNSQVLHRSMATHPVPWMDFSARLRSKTLWKEALIHGTGRFNSEAVQTALREDIFAPEVSAILKSKAESLRNLSKTTQNNLLSYYPETLQRTKTVGRADRDSIGRASYANDIMQWIGLTVWRHWMAQQVCADRTHQDADMGWQFFRTVAQAGESYLDRNQLRQFHEFFPMSLKGESVVENRISELKQQGQRMVEVVLKNNAYLDVERFPAGHLTCAYVGPHDYPWERPAQGDGESSRATRGQSEMSGGMDVDGVSERDSEIQSVAGEETFY